jgi:hypothetical protein
MRVHRARVAAAGIDLADHHIGRITRIVGRDRAGPLRIARDRAGHRRQGDEESLVRFDLRVADDGDGELVLQLAGRD